LMMPLLGSAPRTEPAARARGFDHDRETARPDLYEVELDGDLTMRLAPTDHGAICEIDLPARPDTGHPPPEGADERPGTDAARAVLDGGVRAGAGPSPAQGYDRADGAPRMYVVAEVEPAPVSVQRAREGSSGSVLSFAPGTRRVTVRLATSYLGLA